MTFEIRESLIAEAKQAASVPGKPETFKVYVEGSQYILVPRYFYMKEMWNPFDRVEVMERPLDSTRLGWRGELWDNQKPGTKEAIGVLKKKHGVMIKAKCGSGKTVVGTFILGTMNSRKSAVLVDRHNLAEQWTEQIISHIPNARISYIMPIDKQKKIREKYGMEVPSRVERFDDSGDITIIMAQTLMRTEEPLYKFTTLIVDEAHKFSAPTFAKAIFKLSFRYSVALSAEDKRPDGLEWVFLSILGDTIVPLEGIRMQAKAIVVPLDIHEFIDMKDHVFYFCKDKKKTTTPWACKNECAGLPCPDLWGSGTKKNFTQIYQRLSRDHKYNGQLAAIIKTLYSYRRPTIVFSKYKDHLRELKRLCEELGVTDSSLYFGGMDKDECLAPMITFATYGVAKHGLDAPQKSAVVLGLPVSEAEQIVGRVERVKEGKKQPVIIDPVVKLVRFFVNQSKRRNNYYEEAGYVVHHASNIQTLRHLLDRLEPD